MRISHWPMKSDRVTRPPRLSDVTVEGREKAGAVEPIRAHDVGVMWDVASGRVGSDSIIGQLSSAGGRSPLFGGTAGPDKMIPVNDSCASIQREADTAAGSAGGMVAGGFAGTSTDAGGASAV